MKETIMDIRLKALIATTKFLGFALALGIGYYFVLELVGVQVGMFALSAAIFGYLAWVVYDHNLSRLRLEEESKD